VRLHPGALYSLFSKLGQLKEVSLQAPRPLLSVLPAASIAGTTSCAPSKRHSIAAQDACRALV
jgi:hypothetical protein